jgi:hypothetical protein
MSYTTGVRRHPRREILERAFGDSSSDRVVWSLDGCHALDGGRGAVVKTRSMPLLNTRPLLGFVGL